MSKKNKAPKNKNLKSEKNVKSEGEIKNEQKETEITSEKEIQEEEIVSENNESVEKDDVIIEEKQEDSEQEEKEDTIEDFQLKLTEMNDKYMRLAAEYDNYRRRTLKEKMDLIKNGGTDILKSILPVIDNFERAMKAYEESSDIEAVKDGIELIYNDFRGFLKQKGVVEIETKDAKLDTDLHEAVAQMPVEDKDAKGKIIDVIEKGYKLNDKVLRFAKVVVAQ